MTAKHTLIKGTFLLTAAGLISRLIGFFYKIFLSHAIGAEGVGIFQLIMPVYALLFAFSCSGIETAISRFVSAKKASADVSGMHQIFTVGLCLSLSLSILSSILLFKNADFVAEHLLFEVRCTRLLKILSYTLPFCSIHSCIMGYYLGIQKTMIPAVSQLVEQIIRVTSSLLIWQIMLSQNLMPDAVIAALGLLFSELGAVLFTCICLSFHLSGSLIRLFSTFSVHSLSEIVTFAFPLTGTRVLLQLLHSVEAVCIPLRLSLYGLTGKEALSVYGILTGMALPLIFFPTAVTNAAATMLLPEVSKAQAANRPETIHALTRKTIFLCLWLGFFCTLLFLLSGNLCGTILFHTEAAGSYIQTLSWLCPFLFLSVTLTGILNGLGQTGVVFLINLFSLGIRLLFVWFGIPVFGMKSYLWGLLLAQLFASVFLTLCCLGYQKA